jgi:hypothetical protein
MWWVPSSTVVTSSAAAVIVERDVAFMVMFDRGACPRRVSWTAVVGDDDVVFFILCPVAAFGCEYTADAEVDAVYLHCR